MPPSAIKLAPYANNLGEIEDRDPKPNGSVVSGLVNATSKESVNPISNMDCSASGLMGSITGNSVRVRSSPDALSTTNILFRVNKGDSFFWLESKKNELGESWEKVCFDGKIGWVSSDYIILIGD